MARKREVVRQRKNSLLLPILIIIVLIAVIAIFMNNPQYSAKPRIVAEGGSPTVLKATGGNCVDTDGGLNYLVKGSAISGNVNVTDDCDGPYGLDEAYCNDGSPDFYEPSYDCRELGNYACTNGACIPNNQTLSEYEVIYVDDDPVRDNAYELCEYYGYSKCISEQWEKRQYYYQSSNDICTGIQTQGYQYFTKDCTQSLGEDFLPSGSCSTLNGTFYSEPYLGDTNYVLKIMSVTCGL